MKDMEIKYCSSCGRELIRVTVPAEKIREVTHTGYYHPFNKFNSVTGKKQYASYWKCPKQWLWFHDQYEDDAELLEDYSTL